MILAAGETEMLNRIYDSITIPEDLGKSIIIPTPKSENTTD